MALFRNRIEAGLELAKHLKSYQGDSMAVVLAIPRGGLVLGRVIAEKLRLDLDVVLVKKIGHPVNPELAIGAVGLGAEHWDADILKKTDVPDSYVAARIRDIRRSLRSREEMYRSAKAPIPLLGKTAILIDDGVATGGTMMAAIWQARLRHPARVVVATPVASWSAFRLIARTADQIVCPHVSEDFTAIGEFYEEFGAISDAEALQLLARSHPPVTAFPASKQAPR
jgi:predicted phosphoribosyltransferase